MNQEQIAEKMGISQSMVSHILSGRRAVSKAIAIKLSDAFGREPGFWVFAKLEEIREILAQERG